MKTAGILSHTSKRFCSEKASRPSRTVPMRQTLFFGRFLAMQLCLIQTHTHTQTLGTSWLLKWKQHFWYLGGSFSPFSLPSFDFDRFGECVYQESLISPAPSLLQQMVSVFSGPCEKGRYPVSPRLLFCSQWDWKLIFMVDPPSLAQLLWQINQDTFVSVPNRPPFTSGVTFFLTHHIITSQNKCTQSH